MKEKKCGLFKMIWHVLKLSRKNCFGLFLLFFLLTTSAGVFGAVNVFLKQGFFDVVEGLLLKTTTIPTAMGWGVALAVTSVLILVLKTVSELARTNYYQTVVGHLGQDLNKKASRVEPIVYEDKRFLDLINKAYAGLDAVINVVGLFFFLVLSEISYLVAMGGYFFSIQPLLLVTFVISFIPIIISMVIRERMYANMEYLDAPYRRKYEYFGKCIYSREYAKETRLWRADSYFGNLFRENLRRSSMLRQQTMTKSDLVELGLRFVQLIGYVATVVLLVYYLIQGEVGVGAFAAIFTSLDQMFDRIEFIFRHYLPDLMEGFGPAQNYFAFMDLEERQATYEGELERNVIEFKNVGFSYPCSDQKALDGINLTIHKGETLAIVGVNGSGKSTLTKLLIGQYLPTEGALEIDGIDAKTISMKSMYQGVSAVFQRYQCYKMTVKENAQISDTEHVKPAEPVLKQVDFSLENEKFAEGMDTMLGKDFGGIDLSGGQWQRLAIAKGLYRVHDLIILDEPTAAIDPIEEAKIYRKFAEISKDKTAIIVTHRLGSVHMADRIIVMDAGRIVDMGTHEELMAKNGLYCEMYQAQAKWYA